MTVIAAPGATSSPWSPLRHTLFRGLWIATIVSNVGTWMQDVGAGWLMTSLTSSPALVALVEAADSIPVMLLAMPAWAAIVPDLVRPDELQSAVALNGIAINVSRAIGPAIAGVLVAVVGPWLVFMLNALSYIGIIAVLVRWR